jgi:hypothetical protein
VTFPQGWAVKSCTWRASCRLFAPWLRCNDASYQCRKRRRHAQRIVNLLVRRSLSDVHIKEAAGLLNLLLSRDAGRTLRRWLREAQESRSDRRRPEWARPIAGELELELRLLDTEKAAWERDHPGQHYPELECGLSDRENSDLARWRRQRLRRARKAAE